MQRLFLEKSCHSDLALPAHHFGHALLGLVDNCVLGPSLAASVKTACASQPGILPSKSLIESVETRRDLCSAQTCQDLARGQVN